MDPSLDLEDKLFPQKYTFQINGALIIWDRPQVMGVVNLTPDSFFEGSRFSWKEDTFKKKVDEMVLQGADILDLGGYSSRPGADEVRPQEEIDRVLPALEWIKNNFPDTLLSVDTFRSSVASEAIQLGVHLVNDISAGELDPEILRVVGNSKTPYIAMHMRGNPQTMQAKTNYSEIFTDLLHYFSEKVEKFKNFGINDVIIDVGFGFAKTLDQNYLLLRHLSYFKTLGYPLLVGISRKSMIYKVLETTPNLALNGTTALHMQALIQGANILRVHDVKEAKETVTLYKKLYP